jgi:hypothetical protein
MKHHARRRTPTALPGSHGLPTAPAKSSKPAGVFAAGHPRMEEASLEEVVDKTFRLVKNEFDLHHIRFYQEVNSDFPLYLDKVRAAVLLNLFMNSIQRWKTAAS